MFLVGMSHDSDSVLKECLLKRILSVIPVFSQVRLVSLCPAGWLLIATALIS